MLWSLNGLLRGSKGEHQSAAHSVSSSRSKSSPETRSSSAALGSERRTGAKLLVEPLAVLAEELFRVAQSGAGEGADALRQNDGSSYDRAEERAAANLVDSGDDAIAQVTQRLLRRVRADELFEHPLLRGRG